MTTKTETMTSAPMTTTRPLVHCEMCGYLWDKADYDLLVLLAAAGLGHAEHVQPRTGLVCSEVL
jgi:hypothetical protein